MIYDDLSNKIKSTLISLKNLSEQKQIDAIFSIYQAFHDLISFINESNQLFPSVLESIKICIRSIQSLIYFCSKSESNDKLSPLISEFIRSNVFAPKLKNEFAALANSYLYCNFSCSSCIPLSEFVEDFFSNQIFCPVFEKISGLNSIFNILIDEKKTVLCHKVVNSICPNLKYYYSDNNAKANEFLNKSIEILPMIPFVNSSATFKFLFNFTLSHKPPVMNYFIVEKFEFINKYILSDKEGSLLFIYSIFFDVMNYPDHSEFIKPLSIHLLNLINNSNSCPAVKKNALATLKVFLANFSDELPIDINLIYSICCHISMDDTPSILVFLDMIKFISTHFNTNKILLISAIHPFVTKENALNTNLTDAFEIIQYLNEDFDKCASSFIVPLIKDDSPEELKEMFIKYPIFLNIFHSTLHDPPFKFNDVLAFRLFMESEIYKEKYDGFCRSLNSMLKKESFFPFILTKVADLHKNNLQIVFDFAGKMCRKDVKLKRNWLDNDILKIVNDYAANGTVDPLVYFDFIASLVPIRFNSIFDKIIFDFLESQNYFNQTEEAIQKLAFGRLQSEGFDNSFLVLPSILYKCGTFSIESPSDLFLSSKYSIDIWLDKTGKEIEEFPSIDRISRRYMLHHHFDRLFHVLINELNFENFLNYMPTEFDSIPIVEFNKNVKDTFFSLALRGQYQSSDTFSFTISFWLYFSEKFELENQIFTLSDFSLIIKNKNSFVVRLLNGKYEDQIIGEFEEKTWINFIICYSTNNGLNLNLNNYSNELSIYINSRLKYNMKNLTIPNGITFGSYNENSVNWYIGGYIRIINDSISQSMITNIYNLGVFQPPLHLKNERPLILVTDINPPIDSNIRLAPSSSLLKYMSNSFGNSHGVCCRILKLISQSNEKNNLIAKKLIYSMILNQSLYRSYKNLSAFVLNLSVLANLKNNLFDSPEIFDLINKCFVKVKYVNWESFFTFYLDLNFFEKEFILEKMIKFIDVNNYDFDLNKAKFQDSVIRFCFEMICLLPKEINYKLISDFMSFFDTDIKSMCVYLSSLHNFFSFDDPIKDDSEINFLSSEEEKSFEIMKDNQNKLCKYFINEMNFKIKAEFKDLFILDLVHSELALEFCYILLSIQPKIQRLIDKKKVMSFCMSNVNKIRAWDCVMTLVICSPTSLETNYRIEYDTLDITLIPLFLIMVGGLLSVAHNFEENSKWKKIAFTLISFIESIMENFQHNDQTMFSLMQLVHFNTFVDTECLFPFAPEMNKIEEIANVAVTRSQEFRKGSGSKYEESKIQLLIQKEKICEYVDNVFNSTIQMIPPFSSSEIDFDFSSEDDYSCNYEVKWNSLREYVHDCVRSFGFENVTVDDEYLAKIRVSKVTTDVLDMLSKYLFSILENSQELNSNNSTVTSNENMNLNSATSFSNNSLLSFSSTNLLFSEKPPKNDSLFMSYLKTFTLCFVRIHPSHALFVSQRIILSLLTECINQSVFSLELIDFACNRAREGWFANQVAPLISLVISICQLTCQSNLPYSVYSLLILGFEITPFNQFPIYSEIYVTYQDLIFNEFSCKDPIFYQLFIEYVLKHNEVVPETFSRIWHIIYVNMTKYQLNLKEKWPNGTFDMNYKYVCMIEKEGFSILKNKSDDDNELQSFIDERKRLLTNFIEEQYYTVIQSLKATSSYHYNRSSEFKTCLRDLFTIAQTCIFTSKVVGDVIRERMRKIALFDFDLFYRIRENHITKYQLFEHGKGKGNSIIVLGNQLFPSKRVEKSVLFVNFSAEILSHMIPKNIRIEDDDCILKAQSSILNHLSFDFYPIQNILYSKEQIGILMFSQKLPISDSFLFKSFEILHDSIEFICDASFLYGIEPLNGTIIKSANSLIFVEGLKFVPIQSSPISSNSTNFEDKDSASLEPVSSNSSSLLNSPNSGKDKKNASEDNRSRKMKWKMKFVNQQNISPFAFNFYMNYFAAGYFGPCSLFRGHPMLKWNICDIVNIIQKNKGKSDNEFEYEFNFIFGWTFIIRANLQEILAPLLNTSLPFQSHALSLLRKDVNSASELWTKGVIDNYSYLCYLNMMSGRSFCTFSNFPVFPQIFSDIKEPKLRDLSKPIDQISKEKVVKSVTNFSMEEQLFNASFVYSFFRNFDPYRFLMFAILKKKKIQNLPLCLFNLRTSIDSVSSFEEVVPHFYLVPELCKSYTLPSWCCRESESTDFVFRSQMLLQSDEVTFCLSNWIDLTFGYLFNSSEKVSQVIQLFKKPHEKRQISPALIHAASSPYMPPTLFSKASKEAASDSEDGAADGDESNNNSNVNGSGFGDVDGGGYSFNNVSLGLFGLHLMTIPENIVSQSLNPAMFKAPISELIINDYESTVISMKPLSVFITQSLFLVINPAQGCILKNGNKLVSTSYLFMGARQLSISPDRCLVAVTGREGLVSLWRVKYDGSNPASFNMSTVFQINDTLDSEIFPSVQASQGKSSKSDVKDIKNENDSKSDVKDIKNENKLEGDVKDIKNENKLESDVKDIKNENDSKSYVKDVRDDMMNIKKEDDSVDDSIEFSSIGKVVFSSHHFIALIASGDKLVRFDIGRNRLVSPIRAGYRISCVAIDELAGQIVTCGGFNFTIWTISGGYIYNQVCGVKVSQVAVANLPIYVQNRFIVTGHVDGFLLFWTFDSKLGVIQNLAQKKVTSQPITAITIDESSMRVIASNKENEVFCLDFPGTERSPINRDFAYECPSCKKPFEVSKSASNKNIVNFVSKGNIKVCSKCHRYFCRDCVTALPRRIIQMTNKDYICEFCASLGAK